MAHECPECWQTCHCGGDIEDMNWGERSDCTCCDCDKCKLNINYCICEEDETEQDGYEKLFVHPEKDLK